MLSETLNKTPLIQSALENLQRELPLTDPLFNHSIRTALLLQVFGLDETTISAGLLHHVAEQKIKPPVLEIVQKANKLRPLCEPQKNLKPAPLKKWQKTLLNERSENLRRMFFALSKDIRPILLTLSGRYDEVINLLPTYDKQTQINNGIMALEILAPLAYGLGLNNLKGDLEDAVFPIVYPKEYKWLIKNVKEKYQEREIYLNNIAPRVKDILDKNAIPVLGIVSRAKHYFSLYQKLFRYNMDIEKIYDLVALRIITDNINNCYLTLAVLHKIWQPLPGRIKDYIAQPKPNGYQALHTTVTGDNNKTIEIQISTPEMQKEAEFGEARHLSYKHTETAKISNKAYQKRFSWLDTLRKWQEENQNVADLKNYFVPDLFKNRIFVFTPKKEVLNLPQGSTAIDFAFALHSQIGQQCSGAKINNKIAPIKQPLKTGDVVEILTNKNKKPSSDWLGIVKTRKAKQKIKHFFEDVYGFSVKKPTQVIKATAQQVAKIIPKKKSTPDEILIGKQTGIAYKIAKCCKPKPPEAIEGFINQGEAVSIHKTTCKELAKLKQKNPQRVATAQWL